MSVIDRRDRVKIIDGKTIANNIRAERNRANITIEDVCKNLNVSRPTYIKFEKDASVIKTEFLIRLSNYFECSIDAFFYTK